MKVFQYDSFPSLAIKFSNKKEYLEDLAKGNIYMNESGYFRKLDDNFRGDKFDGKCPVPISSPEWHFETVPFGELKDKIIIPGDDIKDLTIGFKNDDKLPLFCCSAITETILELCENNLLCFKKEFVSEMKQFGKFYMIFDHAEFIKRIHEYVKDNNIGARWGYVVYDDIYNLYDISVFNDRKRNVYDPFFVKDNSYKWQNEWRVVLKPGIIPLISDSENHFVVNIAPMSQCFIGHVDNLSNCTFDLSFQTN